jgi:hypothetical protein
MAATWRERISRAREQGLFTAQDRARAGRWSTCVVGEVARQRRLTLARLKNHCPVDSALARLGICFFAAVLANDVARAEATVADIEHRVRELTWRRRRLAAFKMKASIGATGDARRRTRAAAPAGRVRRARVRSANE